MGKRLMLFLTPVLNKMSDLKLYTPHANQRLVHESKARYRVVVAGQIEDPEFSEGL